VSPYHQSALVGKRKAFNEADNAKNKDKATQHVVLFHSLKANAFATYLVK
jgi:hypothetical protein